MEAAIQVRGLRKSYKDLDVLKGVELDVARGSIFALLGSNGAGKTTLTRILATLLQADGGTATVSGLDVAAQPAKVWGAISLTGQFAAVDEILTGRENLIMIAELRRVKGAGKVADGPSWEGRESMGGCAEFNVAERALVETTPDQTPRPPFPAPQAA